MVKRLNRPRLIILTLLLLQALFASVASYAQGGISSYNGVFKPYYDDAGKLKIAIRAFVQDSKTKFLVVDPNKLETAVVRGQYVYKNLGKAVKDGAVNNTPFVRALNRYTEAQEGLSNHGITETESAENGVFLTVDMCPSRKSFERAMFEATMGLPGYEGKGVPVAIAISGRWMLRHKEEFDWILKEIKDKRLDVTWINHSYSHPYEKGVPIDENFLLTPGVDFEKEVLRNEALMLEAGITPSVFFRFPGLVSDEGLLERLKSLYLIPVGANAWLAKGAAPVEGSIILVHGNGNEPSGIEALLDFYKKRKDDFENKGIVLLPLKDAFITNPKN